MLVFSAIIIVADVFWGMSKKRDMALHTIISSQQQV